MKYEIIFRIIFISVFVITLAISAVYRKRARESGEVIQRIKEGKVILTGRLVGALILLIFILLYAFIPDWISWSQLVIPLWIRWIGVGLALLCPFFSIWIFKNIGKNISETIFTKEDHQLVTSGPYRWVRHPLYSTGILLIFSLGMIASNWVILLLAVFCTLIFQFFVIPKEEEHLVKRFGKLYENYKSTTGRLLPKFYMSHYTG